MLDNLYREAWHWYFPHEGERQASQGAEGEEDIHSVKAAVVGSVKGRVEGFREHGTRQAHELRRRSDVADLSLSTQLGNP